MTIDPYLEFSDDGMDTSVDIATGAELDTLARIREKFGDKVLSTHSAHGDATAVVDQYGRVHGLEGLRVVDASIMPTLVRAPINPTVLMMAERIAAFIRQGK